MRWLLVVLLVLLIWLQYRLWVGPGSLAEWHRLRTQIASREVELTRLRERNRRLRAEVRELRGEGQALEERARRDLGLIREGEVYFQVVPAARGDRP